MGSREQGVERPSEISKQLFRNAGPRAIPGLGVESQGEGSWASADQPTSPGGGGGLDSPGPEERGWKGPRRKGRCRACREARERDRAQASALARWTRRWGRLPSRDRRKEKPPVPCPHSQAVLTTFSPTGRYLAPLSHPHLPTPRAEPRGGPKAKGWGRGSRGEGVVREFPRSRSGQGGGRLPENPGTLLSVGGGVLGRWAGNHQNAFRTLPHLLGKWAVLPGQGSAGQWGAGTWRRA